MKWFKHSVTASRELPLRSIKADYGFYGVGIFWCILERVLHDDGLITVEELEREFCSRYFPRGKVRSIIMDYEFFHIDCHDNVTTADIKPELVSVDTTYTARPYLLNSSYELNKDIDIEEREIEESSLPTATPAPTPLSDEKKMADFMLSRYPRVSRMRKPLTFAEMSRLCKEYKAEAIHAQLENMENYPTLLTKYVSANLTIRKWLRADRVTPLSKANA